MYTDEFLKCPHCGKPRMIPPRGKSSAELLGPIPCSECGRLCLEETAAVLSANLKFRLERVGWIRCLIWEPLGEALTPGTILRRAVRVESLRQSKVRRAECNFDYKSDELCVNSEGRKTTERLRIASCRYTLDDIPLNAIVRSFARTLALAHRDDEKDPMTEVTFGNDIAHVRLAFQQPCQHVPRCSSF